MTIPSDSITQLKAALQNSMLSSLAGSGNDGAWTDLFQLLIANGDATGPLSQITPAVPVAATAAVAGLSATGRNMALADPESAYKMMTLINNVTVLNKAQSSELNRMKTAVLQLRDAGQSLGDVSTGSIKLKLLGFVGQYNNWIRRFNPDIGQGGLLAGTQAAQVSQYELEQSVKSRFFGAGDGVHGMGELGVSIDPQTKLATLDTAKLDAMLVANKPGVVAAAGEFSANFVKAASLLVADGGFIAKQLDNLGKAIHYVADNSNALQQEFGSGETATPAGQVAQALASYNQSAKI